MSTPPRCGRCGKFVATDSLHYYTSLHGYLHEACYDEWRSMLQERSTPAPTDEQLRAFHEESVKRAREQL